MERGDAARVVGAPSRLSESRWTRRFIPCLVACCGLALASCDRTGDCGYSVYLGYIFTQEDSSLERRWLQLPKTAELMTRCYYQELPPIGSARWREIQLDPALHGAVLALLEDLESLPLFEADSAASKEVDNRVCAQRTPDEDWCICLQSPRQFDYCYTPQATISDPGLIWFLGLSSEITLSPQSEALIDALLEVHERCWQDGTAASDFGC